VLVITSLDAHLSAQQQADLATSEELKGAEAAAEAERKKAALEMEERLPGLKDPNAPVTPAAVGPDGKPIVPVPVTPKPIPALHPDRFSPGGVAEPSPGSGMDGGSANNAPGSSAEVPSKPAAPKTQPKSQPAKPNTGAAKPNTGSSVPKTPQLGRAQ
jgi:rod shape-determining protein MreC